MAFERRNMFYENKKQETTEIDTTPASVSGFHMGNYLLRDSAYPGGTKLNFVHTNNGLGLKKETFKSPIGGESARKPLSLLDCLHTSARVGNSIANDSGFCQWTLNCPWSRCCSIDGRAMSVMPVGGHHRSGGLIASAQGIISGLPPGPEWTDLSDAKEVASIKNGMPPDE
ncbi:hypothetical protein AAG570_005710 [Ranatra chinensis]|uniref:Uncharacterized protein n=1 Tax=Ranatra chinensis TaxID=642074 RepID=A0ABD0Y0T1_9HEMI